MSKDESFDENGMLNETGRKNIEFGLQKELYAKQIFEVLRKETTYRINGINKLIDDTPNFENVSDNEKSIFTALFDFEIRSFKDLSRIHDFIEIVNNENFRLKDAIKILGKEITKNKTLSEDSTKVIIEMINKISEEHKFTDKQLQEFINQFRSTLKFTKRKNEDESRDTEKTEDVEKSEDE